MDRRLMGDSFLFQDFCHRAIASSVRFRGGDLYNLCDALGSALCLSCLGPAGIQC
jgi:hypothetical protein